MSEAITRWDDPKLVAAKDLQTGDLVDLYGDAYADPDKNPGEGLEFELATIECVKPAEPVEGVEAVIVYNFSLNFKCPADHQVKVMGHDDSVEAES